MSRRSIIFFVVMTLALSILACNPPIPQPPPDTITPYAPTTAEPTTLPGEPTSVPPATGVPTIESPTEPPPSSWFPDGTFALYATGVWDALDVYALAPGPSSTDLGRVVTFNTALSRTGRWIAHANGPAPATSVVIVNLESGTTYNIPLTTDYTLYGMAFDHAETRLAFMEMGVSGDYVWAIVVVNLADGSTTRFEDTLAPPAGSGEMLPGRPIGWTAAGDELLLDTFVPDSGGFFIGVWAVALPPGTASAPLDTLGRRELIAGGDFSSEPRFSPDGTRLLYLRLEPGYVPAGYEQMGPDFIANQLWVMDIATGAPTRLVNVADGGALETTAAWSQEMPHTLFAQGNYAGPTFAALTLKVRDDTGTIHDAGSVPLPAGGSLQSIDWCLPDFALVVVTTADYAHQLHVVEFGGGSTLITSDAYISVLGCIP